MDSDVLELLLALVVTVVFSLMKRKKKQASAAQKKHTLSHRYQDESSSSKTDDLESIHEIFNQMESAFEEDVNEQMEVDSRFATNEKNDENFAKSEPYFTYEANSEEAAGLEQNQIVVEDHPAHFQSQESENEEETLLINLNNPEDLKKAVLYSEILKNPYIQ